MNKRGSISGWTEGILLTVAFMAVFAIAVAGYNHQYSKNYDLGLSDTSNSTSLFVTYGDTAQTQITKGDVAFDQTQGITLKSSYGITIDVINIIWSFLSGGFIQNLAQAWGIGEAGIAISKVIRIIWFLSLVFALLYALFKVKV